MISDAIDNYKQHCDEKTIMRDFEECVMKLTPKSRTKIKKSEMYSIYQNWAEENGVIADISQRKLNNFLKKEGFYQNRQDWYGFTWIKEDEV